MGQSEARGSDSHEETKDEEQVYRHFLLGTALLGGAFAQQAPPSARWDNDINLLRKDLGSAQKQIIAANVPLTDDKAQKFWSMDEQYNAEKMKINDDKLLVIKDYAVNFQNLTDEQAETLVNKWAQVDRSAVQFRTKYIQMIQKLLPVKKAALFSSLTAGLAYCWICS